MMLRGSSRSQQQSAVSWPLTASERLFTKSRLEIWRALQKVYSGSKVNTQQESAGLPLVSLLSRSCLGVILLLYICRSTQQL